VYYFVLIFKLLNLYTPLVTFYLFTKAMFTGFLGWPRLPKTSAFSCVFVQRKLNSNKTQITKKKWQKMEHANSKHVKSSEQKWSNIPKISICTRTKTRLYRQINKNEPAVKICFKRNQTIILYIIWIINIIRNLNRYKQTHKKHTKQQKHQNTTNNNTQTKHIKVDHTK